jgi:hypothetical protein
MPEIAFTTRLQDSGQVVVGLEKIEDTLDHLGRSGSESAEKTRDSFSVLGKGSADLAKSTEALTTSVTATGTGFQSLGQSVMDFAKNPLEAAKTGVTSFVEKLGPTAVALGSIATAAIAAGVAIFEFVKSGSEAAEKLKNLSAITGMTVQDLQALQQITKEAGLEGMDLGRTISFLNTQMGKPEGKEFETSLQALGITIKDTSGKQKDAIDIMDELKVALSGATSETERSQIALQVLGIRYRDLIPLIVNGTESLRDQMEAMKKTGPVWDKVTQENLLTFDTMLDKIGRSWDTVKTKMMSFFGSLIASSSIGRLTQLEEIQKEVDKIVAANKASAFAVGPTISVEEYQKSLAKLKEEEEALKKSEAAAKKHAAAISALTDEYEKHSKPATVLIDHLEEMVTATRPLDKLIAEYATEIVNAARKQTDLGVSLTNSEKYIVDQATAITTLQDGVEGVTVTVSAFAQELDRLSSLSGPKDELINLGKQMDEDKQKADALADAIIALMPKNTFLADETDKVAAAMKANNEYMAEAKTKAEALGNALADELGGAVDTLSSSLAKNLIDWGGWKDTIIGFGKDIAQTLLTSFLDGFLSPLKSALSSFGQGFGNWLTGLLGGKGGGGFNPIGWLTGATSGSNGGVLGGILGVGAITGTALATTSTLTAATGVPSIMGTIFAGTGGLAAAGGTAAAAGTTAAAGSGGLLTSIGAFATNPITLAVAGGIAAVFGGLKLADYVSGPNSWEAGSEEVARDFGSVEIAPDAIKAIAEAVGISEKEAWGIRKDLLSSPQALQAMYALAEDQGKTAAFLTSLEKIQTSWGDFNFRDAFELGSSTGDWTELNNQFVAAFGNSEKLNEVMPDWKELLLGESSYVSETDLVIEALTTLRDTLQESLPAVQSMYDIFLATGEVTDEFAAQITALGGDVEEFRGFADSMTALTAQAAAITAQTASWESLRDSFVTLTDAGRDMYDIFLETGEITDELADEITSLGGDLSAFESYSRLSAINSSWEELIAHFEETGEILPGLRQMFIDFGGDLSALDAASALEGLTDSLTFIDSLISQLESNLPDPIEQLLAGNMDADTIAALTAAGLDPNQFKGLVSSGAALTQWDKANYQPFQDLTPELESYLKEYGGAAGSTAVSRYYAGQNTITQGLLDTTRLGIEKEYQDEVKTLLEYLGTVQESTTTAIETLTASVETQFDIVGGNIQDALDLAAEDVVTEIDLMIAALGTQSDAIVTAMNAVSQGLIDALDEIITRNTTELVSVLTPTTEPDTYVPSGGGNSTPGDNYGEDGSNYPNPNSYAPSLALGRSVARTGLSAEEGKGGGGVEINIDMRNSRVESPAQFVQEVTAGLKSYFGHGGSLAMLNAR